MSRNDARGELEAVSFVRPEFVTQFPKARELSGLLLDGSTPLEAENDTAKRDPPIDRCIVWQRIAMRNGGQNEDAIVVARDALRHSKRRVVAEERVPRDHEKVAEMTAETAERLNSSG